MKTLYSKYTMKPAPKVEMAKRLLGAPGPVTGVAPGISRSSAPVSFFNRTATSTIAPQAPYGLGGLGAIPGKHEVVNGAGFIEQWSMDDWSLPRDWLTKAGYEGKVDDVVITRANMKLAALKAAADIGSTEAEQRRAMLLGTISSMADAIDRQVQQRGVFGYGETGDKQRASMLNSLNKAIRDLANTDVPQVRPGSTGWNPGVAVNGGGTTPGGFMANSQGGFMANSQGAATADDGPLKGMLALGAVVALGVGVWLIKRKKS